MIMAIIITVNINDNTSGSNEYNASIMIISIYIHNTIILGSGNSNNRKDEKF